MKLSKLFQFILQFSYDNFRRVCGHGVGVKLVDELDGGGVRRHLGHGKAVDLELQGAIQVHGEQGEGEEKDEALKSENINSYGASLISLIYSCSR